MSFYDRFLVSTFERKCMDKIVISFFLSGKERSHQITTCISSSVELIFGNRNIFGRNIKKYVMLSQYIC